MSVTKVRPLMSSSFDMCTDACSSSTVLVDTPRGPAPPLVTGTFTIRDLVHSLLGEAADHLSQTSVVGLTHRLEEASANDTGESLGGLRGVLEKVLGGGSGDAKTNEAAEIEQQSKAYHFDPGEIWAQAR